jgi:hypothetical protein
MRGDIGGKGKSKDERALDWMFVSVLDLSLGAVLDCPTCSPLPMAIATIAEGDWYKYINEHACPKQQYTHLVLP